MIKAESVFIRRSTNLAVFSSRELDSFCPLWSKNEMLIELTFQIVVLARQLKLNI